MRKSVKILSSFILSLSILFVSFSPAQAATYSSVTDANAQLSASVTFSSSSGSVPIYLGTPYDENSTDGYTTTYTENGQRYMVRTRCIVLEQAGVGPLVMGEEICTLCPGASHTTSTSYGMSNTSTFSVDCSLAIPFTEAIISSATVKITHTESLTRSISVSTGESYSFPAAYIGIFGSITYFLGFNYDKYKIVTDRVPIVTQLQNVKVFSWDITEYGQAGLVPTLYDVTLENGEVIHDLEVYPGESIEDYFIDINGEYYYYVPRLVDTLDFNSKTTTNSYFIRTIGGTFMVGRP